VSRRPRRLVWEHWRRWKYKTDPDGTVKRFKKEDPGPELYLELLALDYLEQLCLQVLIALGVPSGYFPYYIGYAKRLWAMGLKFISTSWTEEETTTWLVEGELLTDEYVTRGWDEPTLKALWPSVVLAVWFKRGVYPPPEMALIFTEEWGYGEPPGMGLIWTEPWTLSEPPGMGLLFTEPWSLGDPIGLSLLFTEAWGYEGPPGLSLRYTEAWSS